MVNQDICANRHQGNPESQAAFDRVATSLPAARKRVFEHIQSRGLDGATAQECADAFGIPIHKVSGRFSELKRDGLIRKVDVRNHGGVYVENQKQIESGKE